MVDAGGKSLGDGQPPDGENGDPAAVKEGGTRSRQVRVVVQLNRPPDDTMRVEVTIAKGQRRVEVPFDLKDIPLP